MTDQPPIFDNIIWHRATVTRARREVLNGHRGPILWVTGPSGAGKSTHAHALEEQLNQRSYRTFVLDGDNVRHGLCSDLGFTLEDRVENIRRIGEMAKLFIEAGIIVLTAFISPFRAKRERVRSLIEQGDFIKATAGSRPRTQGVSSLTTFGQIPATIHNSRSIGETSLPQLRFRIL